MPPTWMRCSRSSRSRTARSRNRKAARVERQLFRVGREIKEADEFVEHDAFAENLPDVETILRRHAMSQANGALIQRKCFAAWPMADAEMRLRPRDDVIRQRNHGDEPDEHGDDVQREIETVAGAAADGVNGIGRVRGTVAGALAAVSLFSVSGSRIFAINNARDNSTPTP